MGMNYLIIKFVDSDSDYPDSSFWGNFERILESKYFSTDENTISATNERSGSSCNFLWLVDPENKELFVHAFNSYS